MTAIIARNYAAALFAGSCNCVLLSHETFNEQALWRRAIWCITARGQPGVNAECSFFDISRRALARSFRACMKSGSFDASTPGGIFSNAAFAVTYFEDAFATASAHHVMS